MWADGGRYEGEHKNGLSNGQGIVLYSDGTSYNGQWKNDK